MILKEILAAYWTEETLEYHFDGSEKGVSPLPEPGWYSCLVDFVQQNGNVEITFTDTELKRRNLTATVLRKNIPIAFRRKVSTLAQKEK